MSQSAQSDIGVSPNLQPDSPNILPGYHKCLSCQDYGVTCNGPNLVALGDIGSVRNFHRAMKKARKLSLKAIAEAAPTISDSTINEYFSSVSKDYKWTTVGAIDNAITSICGNRLGLPPLDQTCPATSSEFRQQLTAAELKIAAAELRQAQTDAECEELRRRLAASDGMHLSQVAEMQAAKQSEVDWLKDDIKLWRRFAFILLGIGAILLLLMLVYVALDFINPGSGFIRY